MPDGVDEMRSELLFNMTLELGERQEVGPTPAGHRRIVPITGGVFEGPKLKGRVLGGGGDWLLLRGDGVRVLDVRITLQADDGDLIYMRFHGLWHGAPDVMERLSRGENVDPSRYYFRTAPVFETASQRYHWLNNIIAVSIGQRKPTGVAHRVFAIV